MISSTTSSAQEVKYLQGQVAALEQLLEVYEQETLEKSTRLEQALETLEDRSQQLEKALDEIQRTPQLVQTEKMASLGQLVAGVAHEINNPVNFIHGNIGHAHVYTLDLLGLLELYQASYPEPTPAIRDRIEEIDLAFLTDDLLKLLSSMKTGTQRIREIVRSLRTFSRLDEAEVKVVDIHEGLDSTLMILQHRFKVSSNHPATTIIKEYGQLPPVFCYAGQLNQVFMNILANALDAMEDSGKFAIDAVEESGQQRPTIRVHTEVLKPGWLTICISDNGPGMSAEVQSQLFNPFFTTKPVGKGTGLGLSISYQIITEIHKGRLSCYSVIGEGTEFVIEIPIETAS